MSILAPACQPFVNLRQKTGKSCKTMSAETHPDFPVVMDGVPQYLAKRFPKMFVLEEAQELLLLMKSSRAGVTFMWRLMVAMAKVGYEVLALTTIDHGTFAEMSRKRTPARPSPRN